VGREVNPVTRMLIRLNSIMRVLKEKGQYPMLYVVDRISNRDDAVVLIVDVFSEDREQAEEFVKKILDHLSTYNIKVLGYELASYLAPFKEVWRFVAMVAVER
jgi:ABC-type antimicrobial peptide transport system permease subunit